MFDIVSFGELLIDFTESGYSEYGMRLFEQNPGGAVANCACAVSRLGGKAAVMAKVGADMHGEFLINTLEHEGVDVSGVVADKKVFTTLAFVGISANGEREFSFSRKPGADTCFEVSELKNELIDNTRIFHIGSLSLTNEPSKSATFEAVKRAKAKGAYISYDPNYRASLWSSVDEAVEGMRSLLPYVDIIKLSDEETELLTGFSDPQEAASELLSKGIKCVAVTLGKKGAYVLTKDGGVFVKGYSHKAVDTTGAGDAFFGGFLYAFNKSQKSVSDIKAADAAGFAKLGNATATLCVTKRGGIPSLPNLEEVDEVLKRR